MAELTRSCRYFAMQGAVTHIFSSAFLEELIDGRRPIIRNKESLEEVDFLRLIIRDWYSLKMGDGSRCIAF